MRKVLQLFLYLYNMGNFLQRVKAERAAIKQDRSPVTIDLLLNSGFSKTGFGFQLVDLKVWNTEKGFYYADPKYLLRRVKNAKMLSNLVYGRIDYLKDEQ